MDESVQHELEFLTAEERERRMEQRLQMAISRAMLKEWLMGGGLTAADAEDFIVKEAGYESTDV